MAKLTLATLANLTNQTSAVTTINANSDAIETALENTVSRDGATPNTMNADMDMNGNRVLNLPAPAGVNEPVRVSDLADVVADGVINLGLQGPVSATDNAIARFDGLTGTALQNSTITISDTGLIAATQTGVTASQSTDKIYNLYTIATDNTNVTGENHSATGLQVRYFTGGTTAKGQKVAIQGITWLLQPTPQALNDGTVNGDLIGLSGAAITNQNQGGTAGSNNGRGSAYGMEAGASVSGTALLGTDDVFFAIVSGGEVNAGVNIGATCDHRWGWSVSGLGTATVQGAVTDAAIEVHAAVSTGKWTTGIQFSNLFSLAPIVTTGTLIGTAGSSFTVLKGIDFSGITFSGSGNAAFKSSGWSVDGTGGMSIAAGKATFNATTGAISISAVGATNVLAGDSTVPLLVQTTGTGSAILAIRAASASQQSLIRYDEQSVAKWYLGKFADNSFQVFDAIANASAGASVISSASNSKIVIIDNTLKLTGTSNQLVFQSSGVTGTITWTPTSSGKTLTLPDVTGTLATLAGTEEFTNKTLNASVGKGTWTASGTWTLPAITLGAAITYGGVTLTNAVTGTGKMVLDTAPTFASTVFVGTNFHTVNGYIMSLATGVADPGGLTPGDIYAARSANTGLYGFGNAGGTKYLYHDGTDFNFVGGGLLVSTAMVNANNTVATVLGSVGPVGSHTTVQEWLVFKNASGVVRYVPAF